MFITISIIVALLGYAITPDSTPHADKQCLEVALTKPFTGIYFLKKEKENKIETGFFKKLTLGSPSNHILIPIKEVNVLGDSLRIVQYLNYTKNLTMARTVDFKNEKINPKPEKKIFILGTDRFGRDMLSRLMIGTRITMMVGFIAVVISLFIGIILGSLAGYYRGWIDNLISWMMK